MLNPERLVGSLCVSRVCTKSSRLTDFFKLRFTGLVFVFVCSFMFSQSVLAQKIIFHDMLANVTPEKSEISVIDVMTFEESKTSLIFVLHEGSIPAVTGGDARIVKLSPKEFLSAFPELSLSATTQSVPATAYRITRAKASNTLTLEYTLKIKHFSDEGDDSSGVILSRGVYLAGESMWYPRFDDELVKFRLSVRLPSGWKSVSQGERKYVEDEKTYHLDTWEEKNAQDDIYLIAAKFTEYSQDASGVKAMAFLRDADDAMAKKYLDATAQYMEMYQRLLGVYPYKKFALVENFWETGFGMPSFTLLGPRVIRFPFILYSSYPHELLHNWWGNSVYVNYREGNWAEGLTAYLADHLLKEQRGLGVVHRRAVLQKYTNFTQAGGDFALSRFVSRYDAVTEAVGYGKTLMLFHMLRQKLGDKTFVLGLRKFYQQNRYQVAGYAALESIFSDVSGENLKPFFHAWVNRVGAPVLHLEKAIIKKQADGKYNLTATLSQRQAGEAYELQVPVAVTLEGEAQAVQQVIIMQKKTKQLNMTFDKKPMLIEIDPEFDLFRKLDANETPPSVSQVFGAKNAVIIIASKETPEMKVAYEQLAKSWQRTQSGNISIGFDSDYIQLPVNKAVWLLGKKNKFKSEFMATLTEYPFSASRQGVALGEDESVDEASPEKTLNYSERSIVLVGRNPANAKYAFAFVSAEKVEAVTGLGRKLPHYGKYSYLGFAGDAPTIKVKGQWPTINSPLSAKFSTSKVTRTLSKRVPLVTLAP